MRVLICGAGNISDQLLGQLGRAWEVDLIAQEQDRLQGLLTKHPWIRSTLTGDPSSPVVLDEAGIDQVDYILALSASDRVNLAICEHVRRRREKVLILALVHEQESIQAFLDLGVRVMAPGRLLAQDIYLFLQDPRVKVQALDIAGAEVVELDAADHFALVGRSVRSLQNEQWQVVALYRQGGLIFPEGDTSIERDDQIVILGQKGVFNDLCSFMGCGLPHFPLTYGQTLVLSLLGPSKDQGATREGRYLARKTRAKDVQVIVRKRGDLSEELPVEWPESKPVTIREVGQKTQVEAFKWADQNFNPGLVVSPVLSLGWLDFLRLPRHVELVYAVGCPVLFSRASAEYQNILVGFDGSKSSLAGLDVAVDMARQTGAGLAAGMVMESEVIQGAGSQQWLGQAREVLRETAHIHKLEIQEWVQSGNPVRGLSALAKGADLLILGCNRPQRALLHLNVPELVLRRVDCSVLLVPA